jgi:tRNA (cmo5U34)-methyltransferase
MRDEVFKRPIAKQFEFDEAVASVFDDMLSRSIPFYAEALELVAEVSVKYTREGSRVTDLGCSTANTLLSIARKSRHGLNLIGIDNSHAMIERARKKAEAYGARIELIEGDILTARLGQNSVIIANYMLQFIRPPRRLELVRRIYEGLEKGGVFIFSEKIIYDDKALNKRMIDIYLAYKKSHGYSDFEIAQKREALENVLVPYTERENEELMKSAGFDEVASLFKYANFATFVALKK